MMASSTPPLPIPISLIADHYFIFSVDAASYLRREHHICGVLTGTLPQIPQQNVFLSLPLELMAEEVRLLVERGVAYVVLDTPTHEAGMVSLATQDAERHRYMGELAEHGRRAAEVHDAHKAQGRQEALRKKGKQKKEDGEDGTAEGTAPAFGASRVAAIGEKSPDSKPAAGAVATPADPPIAFGITPATSAGLLPPSTAAAVTVRPRCPLPPVPSQSAYALFVHLHSLGYYLSPGLRFGCRYLAYPGDSLRFHSHFLVEARQWDEAFEPMALVVGGRLGTGVKKGFLIGGEEPKASEGRRVQDAPEPEPEQQQQCSGVGRDGDGRGDGSPRGRGLGRERGGDGSVRMFSIEWAGM